MSYFFFNDTATTEIYTLSLHDALPIFAHGDRKTLKNLLSRDVYDGFDRAIAERERRGEKAETTLDRKSTRLNSSHANISYAVFCLKKKHKPERRTLPYTLPLPLQIICR